MDKYEVILRDIKAILETIGEVNKVEFTKAIPVNQEDTFTSVYIVPTADTFELFKNGKGIDAYDNRLYIRLVVNTDNTEEDLLWVSTRRKIIDAILKDSAIWSSLVDRDIVSISYDDGVEHPRRTMEMIFEFRVREECIV